MLGVSFDSSGHLVGMNLTPPERTQGKFVVLESRIILSALRYHFPRRA